MKMNDQVLLGQQTFILKPFMQQYPFCETVGAKYRDVRTCYDAEEVALHLIDGRVQINVIETLRALAKRFPQRYARLGPMADQLEAQLVEKTPTSADLFA
jgi:hypothetical protein